MKNKTIIGSAVAATFFLLTMESLPAFGTSSLPPEANEKKETSANLKVFEKDFVETKAASDTKATAKGVYRLFGYTTVRYEGEERAKAKALWETHKKEITAQPGCYTAADGSFMRMYMPLAHAVVEYKGIQYTADADGFVSLPGKVRAKELTVVGRAKTERSIATQKDTPLQPETYYKRQHSFIFQLGQLNPGKM